jgi:hypothetical protein
LKSAPLSHQRRTRSLLVAGLCLVILLPAFASRYDAPGDPMDEGMALVYPELVQHGAVPYRDFETVYGPGNWWLLSGVYAVFGTHIYVERTVGLLYRVVCLIAIFALARRWGLAVAGACMLLAGSILINTGPVALSWWGAMACALSSLWLLADSAMPWRCVGAGVIAGLAILFRVDVAPALCLAALPILWKLNWSCRLLLAGAAGVTAITPLLVVAYVVGVGPVLNDLFLLPVLHSSPARNLPFSGVDFRLLLFFAVHLVAVVLNVAAGIIAMRMFDDSRTTPVLLAVALLAAGITHQPYHRLDFIHLLFAAFLTISFLPVSLLVLASAVRGQLLRSSFSGPFCAGAAALLFLCMPSIRNGTIIALTHWIGKTPRSSFFVQQNDRGFPLRSPSVAVMVERMLEKLDLLSKPGERLFVGPADLRRTNYSDTFIYHLMPKLPPASPFLEMNPFSANAPGSRLSSDLEQADWIVLNRAWDDWPEQNRSRENGPDEPLRVIRNDFMLVEEYGSFELFRRKAKVGVD